MLHLGFRIKPIAVLRQRRQGKRQRWWCVYLQCPCNPPHTKSKSCTGAQSSAVVRIKRCMTVIAGVILMSNAMRKRASGLQRTECTKRQTLQTLQTICLELIT